MRCEECKYLNNNEYDFGGHMGSQPQFNLSPTRPFDPLLLTQSFSIFNLPLIYLVFARDINPTVSLLFWLLSTHCEMHLQLLQHMCSVYCRFRKE